VTLYLPQASLLPKGAEVGLFVCGGCLLISAKFCAMCAALAQQKLPQAIQMVLLLSADWISALHLLELVTDEVKTMCLLIHLEIIGLIQLRICMRRIHLCARFRRALARRSSVREAQLAAAASSDSTAQLRLMEAGMQAQPSGESSDSDDEDGPGSLPDGFHDSLFALMGIPARQVHTRRQFLCAARQAVIGSELVAGDSALSLAARPMEAAPQVVPAAAPLSPRLQQSDSDISIPSVTSSESSEAPTGPAPPAPLEIFSAETKCGICLETIKTGDKVRPLPKCAHIYHADCLETWAKYQREKTRCPMCRQPALAKREAEGTISISSLTSDTGSTSSSSVQPRATRRLDNSARRPNRTRSGSNRSGRGSGNRTTSSAAQAPASRPPARPPPETISRLQSFLGISEALAHVALELSNSSSDAAASLIFSHRDMLESLGGAAAQAQGSPVPEGVFDAVMAANPHLAGAEAQLRFQLGQLAEGRRLGMPTGARTWADLDPPSRLEVFRAVLGDVVRHHEQEQIVPR